MARARRGAAAVGGIPDVITGGGGCVDGRSCRPPTRRFGRPGAADPHRDLGEHIAEAVYRTVLDRFSIEAQVPPHRSVYD